MALNKAKISIDAQDNATPVLNRVGKSLGAVGTRSRALQQNLALLGFQMRFIGRRMGDAAQSIGSSFKGAMKLTMNYGEAVDEIRTIADRTEFPLNRIKEMTKEMSVLYSGDLVDQSKALYTAISSGATDAASATDLMHAANKLAIAGLSDSKTTIDLLTTTLNSYGLSYDKAGDISDKFFTAVRIGKTRVPEMSKYIGQTASTASVAGMKLSELSAAIAEVTKKGVNTRRTVTSLRQALSNVAKPTKAAREEAKRLGVEFTSVRLREVGFSKFLEEITSSADYTEDSMTHLFGSIQAKNAILGITQNNMKNFKDTLKQVEESAGATQRAYDIMSKGMKFQTDILKSTWTVFKTELGEAVLPVLRVITTALKAIADGFVALPKPVKAVIAALVIGTAVFLGIASGAIILVGTIATLATMLTPLAIGLSAGILAFSGLSVAIAAIVVAIAGFKTAWHANVGGIADWIDSFVRRAKLGIEGLKQLFKSGMIVGEAATELKKDKSLLDFVIAVWAWGERAIAFFTSVKESFSSAVKKMGPLFKSLISSLDLLLHAFGLMRDTPQKSMSRMNKAIELGATVGRGLSMAFRGVVLALIWTVRFVVSLKSKIESMADTGHVAIQMFNLFADSLHALAVALGISDKETSSSTSSWRLLAAVAGYVASAVLATAIVIGILAALTIHATATMIGLGKTLIRMSIYFTPLEDALIRILKLMRSVAAFTTLVTGDPVSATFLKGLDNVIGSYEKRIKKGRIATPAMTGMEESTEGHRALAGMAVSRPPPIASMPKILRPSPPTMTPTQPALGMKSLMSVADDLSNASAMMSKAKPQVNVTVNNTLDGEDIRSALMSVDREFGPTPTVT